MHGNTASGPDFGSTPRLLSPDVQPIAIAIAAMIAAVPHFGNRLLRVHATIDVDLQPQLPSVSAVGPTSQSYWTRTTTITPAVDGLTVAAALF